MTTAGTTQTEAGAADTQAERVSTVGGPHIVQFYDDDATLARAVVDFLAPALAARQSAVIVATPAHVAAFEARLMAKGFDIEGARASGRLVVLDAEETLHRLVVDGWPDWGRMVTHVPPLIEAASAQAENGQVRVYGEMVDVLWRQGNQTAALRLEEMWCDLQRTASFSLLCAYAFSHFYVETGVLDMVCGPHTHVLPPAGGQQSVAPVEHLRSLVAEIAHRKDVERALRASVHELHEKEAILRRTETELRFTREVADFSAAESAREERERRAERLKTITAAVADAVSSEQVFEAVVDQAGAALGASTSALWLLRSQSATIQLCRSSGYADSTRKALEVLPLDQQWDFLPVVTAARTGELVWIESQDDLVARYPESAGLVTPDRHYSAACLPVAAQGRTLGVLVFTFDDVRPLNDDSRTFLLLVARYAGQALERLRLFEAEQRSRLRAELLYGMAAAVIGAERVDDVFDAALGAIEWALGTDRTAILLADGDGIMRVRAGRNLSEEDRREVEGQSPWPRDARSPQAIVHEKLSAGVQSVGHIPLVAGGTLLGRIAVFYSYSRTLVSHELELARAIADHVAAAVSRFTSLADLQKTVRLNEILTGILGHDLRNPLSAILTSARVAMKRDTTERLQKPLARILNSGDRMTRMIDQLLDFTRVRLGAGLALARARVDLGQLVRQVVDELEGAHPEARVRLGETGEATGDWDPDRLSQVFSNLIGNAVEHGAPGTEVEIDIDGRDCAVVSIEIRNHGAIPRELLSTLFEPMAGGLGPETGHGLGLGMYISHELVRAHRGAIDVTSDAQDGTVVSVRLPRARPPGSAGTGGRDDGPALDLFSGHGGD